MTTQLRPRVRVGAGGRSPALAFDVAVRTEGLTKRFGSHTAVDAVDLEVPSGAVYGFLGPNGSGKTTTIRMLLGLVMPSSGTVSLLGEPMPERAGRVLAHVGALVEGPAFHPYLSGRANLARLEAADRTSPRTGRAGRAGRIDTALERVGLLAAGDKRYRAYSLGMRQRLGLAAALMRPRELLILDEPTNGLDPQGTREVRRLIHEVADEGTTVFVSSHLLSEVEQVCTHLGVMRGGRLVAQGSVDSLRGALSIRILVESRTPEAAGAALREFGLASVAVDSAGARADLGDTGTAEEVVEALVRAGVPVRQFIVQRPGLEEMFVSLTGEGFDVDE